jgi:hypothetical protein
LVKGSSHLPQHPLPPPEQAETAALIVAAVDSTGRTIWIADAHRGDGKRFVVRADEKLTAFLGLETSIRWH